MEIDSFLKPPEKNPALPCQHPDFRPGRPISDFRLPKLDDNKFVLFKPLGLWSSVIAALGTNTRAFYLLT